MRVILDAPDSEKWRDIVSWLSQYKVARLVRLHAISESDVRMVLEECEDVVEHNSGGRQLSISLNMLLRLDDIWNKLHKYIEAKRQAMRRREMLQLLRKGSIKVLSPREEQVVREEIQRDNQSQLVPILETILALNADVPSFNEKQICALFDKMNAHSTVANPHL